MPEPEPFRFILTKTGTVFRTVPFRLSRSFQPETKNRPHLLPTIGTNEIRSLALLAQKDYSPTTREKISRKYHRGLNSLDMRPIRGVDQNVILTQSS